MMHWILRSRVLRTAVAVLVFSGGVVAGVGTAVPSQATTYSYTVWNYPGNAAARVYCGWHYECAPGYPQDGDSIDWPSPTSGTPISWRSWSSNNQGVSWVGTILVVNMNSGNCYRVDVGLRSPWTTHISRTKYLHTEPYGAGSTYYVNSSLSGTTSSSWVGTTTNLDCGGTYPNHLHQGYVDGWTRNASCPLGRSVTATRVAMPTTGAAPGISISTL